MPTTAPRVADLKRSTSDQYVDINNQLAAQTKTSLDNGRLTFASRRWRLHPGAAQPWSSSTTGYFAQGKNPASVDLNSGTNFRRAQFGFQGTAWKRLVLQFHL